MSFEILCIQFFQKFVTPVLQKIVRMMNAAVIKMLGDLGVDEENIMLDNFGG